MIKVRATELEAFSICPAHYRYNVRDQESVALTFGTGTHDYIESSLAGELSDERAIEILDPFSIKDKTMIRKMCILIENWVANEEMTFVTMEQQNKFLFGGVEARGTFDLEMKTKQEEIAVIDLKTASSFWTPEQIEQAKQKIYYPAMYYHNRGVPVKYFYYLVMTKRVTPKLQVIRYEVDGTETDKLKRELLSLAQCHKDDTFLPTEKYSTHICRRCNVNCEMIQPIF